MATINDFIQQATSSLGIEESTVRSATGGLLGFLQSQIGAPGAQKLFAQIPGAADLAAPPSSGSTVRSSSILGNITRMAGSALGGSRGAALGLVGTLKGQGLKFGQVPALLNSFVSFVEANVSPELMKQLMEKAPELRKYTH